jgi:YfiH family protein
MKIKKNSHCKIINKKGARFITLPALSVNTCVHAFGTRDTGLKNPIAHARIKKAFPGINEIATVRQVHGRIAVRILKSADVNARRRAHADIIIVKAESIAAAVRTADCVPVLIHAPGQRVAAAVHSGWKGTARRAAAEAVRILCDDYGCRASGLLAGIGPCIGACHYQVDEPVIKMMKHAFGRRTDEIMVPDEPGKARLDLSLANRIILEEAGLAPKNIQEVRMCTYCREDLFFSYRREGKGVPSLYHFIALT